MNAPKFNVGDRVSRPVDVYAKKSPLRFGRVTRRYARTNRYGHYPEIYTVVWDGERTAKTGYLPHGLDPEPDRASPPEEERT